MHFDKRSLKVNMSCWTNNDSCNEQRNSCVYLSFHSEIEFSLFLKRNKSFQRKPISFDFLRKRWRCECKVCNRTILVVYKYRYYTQDERERTSQQKPSPSEAKILKKNELEEIYVSNAFSKVVEPINRAGTEWGPDHSSLR